jgi:hypothetical protein
VKVLEPGLPWILAWRWQSKFAALHSVREFPDVPEILLLLRYRIAGNCCSHMINVIYDVAEGGQDLLYLTQEKTSSSATDGKAAGAELPQIFCRTSIRLLLKLNGI